MAEEEKTKEESKKTMVEKLKETTEEAICTLLEDGIQTSDVDLLYKLTKINHIAKESENMNYGNYNGYGNYGRGGNYGNYNNYGRENYGEYGARGYDRKYRGHEHLDRMYGEYGRYSENRERYGAGQEADKSFHYMVEALEDFIKVLHEEADTPQQKQMLNETLQRSIR